MELGDALFGHSHDKYPLNRDKGFEDVLNRLLEVCTPGTGTSGLVYGMEFENDVFAIRPYYWGSCTCEDEQSHKEDCPIVKPVLISKQDIFTKLDRHFSVLQKRPDVLFGCFHRAGLPLINFGERQLRRRKTLWFVLLYW
jgi:hypothetical protein